RQLEKNDEYELLKPVYGLSLLNDKFPGGSGDSYHHYRLVQAGAREQVIRDLQLPRPDGCSGWRRTVHPSGDCLNQHFLSVPGGRSIMG
ncbi:MAG: hypothetical protein KGS60_17920, partial [Verrucomicrobia bacterium]|nr:hypothetical protein [Verrucomicrobiota bacterium]